MLVYAICADLIWNSKQILKSRTKFILAADEPLHDKRVGGRWWPDYGWYGIICPNYGLDSIMCDRPCHVAQFWIPRKRLFLV